MKPAAQTQSLENLSFGSGEIVWQPTPELAAQSRLQQFLTAHGLLSLEALQQRSTSDIAWFWKAVLKNLDIRFRHPFSQVVDLSAGPAWPRWCDG